ncbi:unnamed protein product [Brassica rapa subsp. trilocularis]
MRACRRRGLSSCRENTRFPTVRVVRLSYPIYFRIWTRVLSPEEIGLRRISNGGNLPFSGFVFPGGGGFVSSASPAKSPGGRGSPSSASSDLAPRGEGFFFRAFVLVYGVSEV